MNVFSIYLGHVHDALNALVKEGAIPAGLDFSRVVVEPPKDESHGDLATNAAMVLAKEAKQKPRDIAEKLAAKLKSAPHVAKADVAGPGFINLSLENGFWLEVLRAAIGAGKNFGRSGLGKGEKVNVEYVSANPTGPMHVGHGRGAVFGDALANLLSFAGYAVTREYYINDAGAQVDVLARSAFLRYREALGDHIGEIPEGLYPGDYLVPVGKALAEQYGGALLQKRDSDWLPIVRQTAID
ncbi:MAG: arginine--tRNA ligase, partial [Xanthobacteraceae bacterium]|nr:arginine--tRNA ligase [Xanthobacteraceae bacterium]